VCHLRQWRWNRGSSSDEAQEELTRLTAVCGFSAGAECLIVLTMGGWSDCRLRDWMRASDASYLRSFVLATPHRASGQGIAVLQARVGFVVNPRVCAPNMLTTHQFLALGGPSLYSIFATSCPGLFPEQYRQWGTRRHRYSRAAVVIIALVFVGQCWNCRRGGERTRRRHDPALLDLAPKTGWRRNLVVELNSGRRWKNYEGASCACRPRGRRVTGGAGTVIEGGRRGTKACSHGESMPVEKAHTRRLQ